MKELGQFLLDRAMEHDSPTLLFNLAREYLMSAKVIRPGTVTLAKMAWNSYSHGEPQSSSGLPIGFGRPCPARSSGQVARAGPDIEQRRPWMATVRQALRRELLNHIGAEVKYPAELVFRQVPFVAPPRLDASSEGEPPVGRVSCRIGQGMLVSLLHQFGHDAVRQVPAPDLSHAVHVTDLEYLVQQVRKRSHARTSPRSQGSAYRISPSLVDEPP
jgi:hypothetical protein